MLVPSIDIMDGKVVQLRQGKELVLCSNRDPIELAKEFNRYGEVAVIDLDGAMEKGSNTELIEKMCSVADVRVGGGIRTTDMARRLLKAGARQLIFGTNVKPDFLAQFPPDLVMVALDHRNGEITDQGWQHTTGESLIKRAQRLSAYCSSFLCTFIEQEGTMEGLPLAKVKELADQLQKSLTVAGGIATEQEVVEISRLGIDVQVGMALYRKAIDPVACVVQCLSFSTQALIPTIVQDLSGQVLMFAYSNAESLEAALRKGRGIYWSRSRNQLWEKGTTSGNTQQLVSCRVDCDRDALLFTVQQRNVACHRHAYSCFGSATGKRKFSMEMLFEVLQQRKHSLPADSFSSQMFRNKKFLLKKILEEAVEVSTFDSVENLRWEIADLLYCLSVLSVQEGVGWQEIIGELAGRRKQAG